MGELSRERRGRDLRLSRSHFGALSLGALAALVLVFLLGVFLGRSSGSEGRYASRSAADGVDNEALVDLLARVDAKVVADDGVETLTFPEELTKTPIPSAEGQQADGGEAQPPQELSANDEEQGEGGATEAPAGNDGAGSALLVSSKGLSLDTLAELVVSEGLEASEGEDGSLVLSGFPDEASARAFRAKLLVKLTDRGVDTASVKLSVR